MNDIEYMSHQLDGKLTLAAYLATAGSDASNTGSEEVTRRSLGAIFEAVHGLTCECLELIDDVRRQTEPERAEDKKCDPTEKVGGVEMNLTPIRVTPGVPLRTAILKHARKLDDLIMLARKIIKSEPDTPVNVALESLLKAAIEEYFGLNEAALQLPDDPTPAPDAEVKP